MYIIEYLKQKYDYTSIIDILIDIDDSELHIDAHDMNILNEALSYDDDLDFSIENYKRTDFYTMGAHIDYRFYKIYDTIHKEPELLRNYIKATNTVPTSSLIYMSDVYPDILNITRYSDNDELSSTTKQNIEVFNTPRCLFKISNSTGSLLNMRVYIDGILYTDIHNVLDIHLEIEYFYIELSKLKYEKIEKLDRTEMFDEFSSGIELSEVLYFIESVDLNILKLPHILELASKEFNKNGKLPDDVSEFIINVYSLHKALGDKHNFDLDTRNVLKRGNDFVIADPYYSFNSVPLTDVLDKNTYWLLAKQQSNKSNNSIKNQNVSLSWD
jgi:hypothetical protein